MLKVRASRPNESLCLKGILIVPHLVRVGIRVADSDYCCQGEVVANPPYRAEEPLHRRFLSMLCEAGRGSFPEDSECESIVYAAGPTLIVKA
jgi:hypothetical protein